MEDDKIPAMRRPVLKRSPTKTTRPQKRRRQDQDPHDHAHSKTSTTSPSTTANPPPTLLTLPAEIRNQIYSLVLSSSSTPAYLCPFALSLQTRKYTYSLTQTCRQTRFETLTHFYATKTLLLNLRAPNLRFYVAWLKHVPSEAFPAIRRVVLEDYQHAHDCNDEEGREGEGRQGNGHPGYCSSAIVVNLGKGVGKGRVRWRRDRGCFWCGDKVRDAAVESVRAFVGGCGNDVVLGRHGLEGLLRAVGRED